MNGGGGALRFDPGAHGRRRRPDLLRGSPRPSGARPPARGSRRSGPLPRPAGPGPARTGARRSPRPRRDGRPTGRAPRGSREGPRTARAEGRSARASRRGPGTPRLAGAWAAIAAGTLGRIDHEPAPPSPTSTYAFEAAQSTQRTDHGRASRRASGISLPHRSQIP